ncbi:uncharacterized protein LOC141873930 [Acropora palmata]|uniref:uncharacterized protein LOC141873930 n=1 Tax=Acropora palmata TaxID=6131 RepID=UPI003DA10F7E
MAYAGESRVAAEDSVYQQIEDLQRRLDETNNLLQSTYRGRSKEQRLRSELTDRHLKDIEGTVEENTHKQKPPKRLETKSRCDETSEIENLHSFVEWRAQLRVLHDALEEAIEELSRYKDRKARRAIAELQELKDDALALEQTAEWTEDDIQKLVQRNNCKDLQSTKNNLRSILNDAERVRRLSGELSSQMKNEVQSLRDECVAMVKDMVALNRILEDKKRALVE